VTHENTDISIAGMQCLAELTDPDVVLEAEEQAMALIDALVVCVGGRTHARAHVCVGLDGCRVCLCVGLDVCRVRLCFRKAFMAPPAIGL
jgi:hypothetical protein